MTLRGLPAKGAWVKLLQDGQDHWESGADRPHRLLTKGTLRANRAPRLAADMMVLSAFGASGASAGRSPTISCIIWRRSGPAARPRVAHG
jgi:hypothetical protein